MERFRVVRAALLLLILLGLALATATSCTVPDYEFLEAGEAGARGVDPNHCSNRVTDADETDVDCGGRDCEPCGVGRSCVADSDCENGECTNGICQDAACTDGTENGEETDTDCGGPSCPACGPGRTCLAATDCESQVCSGGVCAEPSCGDRVQNGTEVDVDCGGADCDRCSVGQRCVIDADCEEAQAEEETVRCVEGACALTCPAGTADCNSDADDGCETNLNTSLDHCGGCGMRCVPANAAEAQCAGGECQVVSCDEGFDDCNTEQEDGCEVELATDPMNCGACDNSCTDTNGTPGCSDGGCTIACDDGFDDCSPDADGCEANLSTSVLHCTACNNECMPEPGDSAACDGTMCLSITCNPGGGDCGGEGPCGACDPDQTCNDVLTTITNCGGCGITCSVQNGTPACADEGGGSFACAIASCDGSPSDDEQWEDCDGVAGSCEVDVKSSARRCGGCLDSDANPGDGVDCGAAEDDPSLHVLAATCVDGGCEVVTCDAGWADCDGDFDNGCEVDTTMSAVHCGGCSAGPKQSGGINCRNLWANADGSCNDSSCVFEGCDTNFGNCANGLTDGCETDLRSSNQHCGGCGQTCQTNPVTSSNSCVASNCQPTCSGAGEDCDGNPRNGCENKDTNAAHCGACNQACQTPTGTTANTCSSGSCTPTCLPGGDYEECTNPRNGCENTLNNRLHCGACGTVCDESVSARVDSNTCSGGTCQPDCQSGWFDCDGQPEDGCEQQQNLANCGGCGMSCSSFEGTPACSGSGACSMSSCSSGFENCNNENTTRDGCETPIVDNPDACGSCTPCGGSTPFCVGTSCQSTLAIGFVNSKSVVGLNSAQANDLHFQTTYALSTSADTNDYRALIVVLGYEGNNEQTVGDVAVTVDGVSMTRERWAWNNQAGVGLFYLLSDDLPTLNQTVTVRADGPNFGNSHGFYINVLEYINVEQEDGSPFAATAAEGSGGGSCSPNLSVTNTANGHIVGGLVVQTTGLTINASSGQTRIHTAPFSFSDTSMAAGREGPLSAGSQSFTWSGCSGSEWTNLVGSLKPAFNAR